MAQHTITLTPENPDITLDQANYVGDDVVLIMEQIGPSTVNVIDPSGVSETLQIQIALHQQLTDLTVNIASGAKVLMPTLYHSGTSYPDSVTYNIGSGGSFETFSHILDNSPPTITFNGGSILKITNNDHGYSTPKENAPILNGLSAHDKIIVSRATSVEYEGNDLVFFDEYGEIIVNFKVDGLDKEAIFLDPTTGEMVYACFLKGTHIATPSGEVKVEDLRAGDQVLTARGGISTVKWIGYRTLRKAFITPKDAIRAFPITFVKDAIGPNLPHRTLTISPGHHVYFDGKLIPAMLLVNGKTITQDFEREEFQYFHVELDSFDIVLAEGVPTESYVDTGNRRMFQNAHTVAMIPDFGPAEGRPVLPDVEVICAGPAVEAIRKRLLKRAEALTKSIRVSAPDLRIEINGSEIYPEIAGKIEGIARFVLPVGTQNSDIRILSRSAIVRDTTAQARRDLRNVGVGLVGITVKDDNERRDIDINDPRLSGLHNAQDVNGVTMRWTDGAATIPAALLSREGQAVLELHVLRTYWYWEQTQHAA